MITELDYMETADDPLPESLQRGSLDVLNCGAGDLKFRFDKNDPEETERARKVIQDMLKRGYVILAEIDGEYRKVVGFDAATDCYLIHDTPTEAEQPAASPKLATVPKKRGRKKGVPVEKTKVTAFAPTSGG